MLISEKLWIRYGWMFLIALMLVASRLFSQTKSTNFIKGADVSFIPQVEDLGGVYSINGVPTDPLQIFKDQGFNYIRLKLWHTPAQNYNNLDKILYMAQRIKAQDMDFLLNFHYSDTWADPGKQTKPAAWRGLSFEALNDSVYQYTKHVIRSLYEQQTLPDMVQIGNEITPGMLWNDGRVGGSYDTPQQWQQLGELIKSAIRGVRENCADGDSVRIMIHIDRGGNNSGARWFFDHLLAEDVQFDVIGLSYYPWWHGTLDAVKANLNDLAGRYEQDLVIVESAYPWTLQWYDSQNNIVSNASQLHDGYPASIDGQANFMRDLMRIIRNTRNGKGKGLFYWAPEYISVPELRSPWENVTLFDFDGYALSSMQVFNEQEPSGTPINVTVRLNTATMSDTLQPWHVVQLRGEVSGISYDILPDGKKINWEASSDIILDNVGGDYWQTTFQMYPDDELSFKFWTGYDINHGTYQRLGWESAITPVDGLSGNRRVLVAGERDTVMQLQFYNSNSTVRDQYWRPYELHNDSIAIYFRVNMGNALKSGYFNPELHGPVAVRGDSIISGSSLSWTTSKISLTREQYSVNGESFWSGVCYIPRSAVQAGDLLEYLFYIENHESNGWEKRQSNRTLVITPSLVQSKHDTTLHWDYFDVTGGTNNVTSRTNNAPRGFGLKQNYPNPFNHQTKICYHIDHRMRVRLSVYNMRGQRVATLIDHEQSSGDYAVGWDAVELVTGIYLIRLETDTGVAIRKTLLLK